MPPFTIHHWLIFLAIAVAISWALLLFLFVRYRMLTATIAYLTRGKRGAHLEDTIRANATDIAALQRAQAAAAEERAAIATRLRTAITRTAVVRFNPFQDIGGNQSFALALLDERNTGIVISSLHTRDGTRIYAKPVVNGTSSYTLSEEEKQAIATAQNTPPLETHTKEV